jgi:AraC-like DNA-binding protein
MDNLEYDYKLLKNTRLAKGLSSDSVAFDLCLAERQIHSIENNLPDFFYSPIIKLACIKKYAEKLELDIDLILYKKEIIKVQEKTLEKNKTRIKANLTYDPLNTNQKTDSKKSHPRIRHENNQPNHIIIQLSVEYIKNNLSSKITIEDLTKITGYSERSLQLVFKKELNQSPIGYLEAERLEKAKALIQMHKQSKKISEIARDVGLIHLGRFSINFKRRFGISPSLLAKA